MLEDDAEPSWSKQRTSVSDAIRAKTGGRCYYCGTDLGKTYDVDHVIPRSRGGTSHTSNLVPSCKPCNSEKRAMTVDEWRAHKGRMALSRERRMPGFTKRQREWLEANGFALFADAPHHEFWFESAEGFDATFRPIFYNRK